MKKIIKATLLALSVHLTATFSFGQNNLLEVSGLYRMDGTVNSIKGKIIENDTMSSKRNSPGYALIDLGLGVNPFKELRVSSILRAKTFTGDIFGLQNRLIFRQIRVEGNLAKVIKYELGDVDLEMTKYTIYNNQEMYNDFEGEVFSIRRQIVAYENFNIGNSWRLQGAKFSSALNFNKYISRIRFDLNGNRVRKTNLANIPDRYILSGRVMLKQSKYLSIGVNSVNLTDDVGSALDTAFNYSNNVLTSNYNISIPINNFELNFYGELGNSIFRYSLAKPVEKDTYKDFFYDLGIETKYTPLGIKLYGEYRQVGGKFSSPTSQTLRLNHLAQASSLGLYNSNNNNRSLSLLDRMSDFTIYNQTIYSTLMQYNPVFGNVIPYGQATPNRTGLTIGAIGGDTSNFINFKYSFSYLSEVTPEGTDQLRKFNTNSGGLLLNLGKLLATQRLIKLNTGFRFESTTRGGGAPIKFDNSVLDFGLEVETITNIDLVGGYKIISAKGNELLASRDIFNNVKSFATFDANTAQSVLTYGAKARFFKNSFFALLYNRVISKDIINSNLDYSMNQFWGNLSIIF